MKRRWICAIAIGCTALLFAGCAGTPTETSAPPAPASEATSDASNATEPATPSAEAQGTDEPVTLSVLTFNTTDYGDRVGVGKLADMFHTTFQFEYIGADTAVEKFNIMVQSDTLPDLIIEGGKYMTNSEMYRLGAEGVFMAMNDLVEKFGVNTQKVWAEHPEYEDAATAPDGNIYALPAYYYGLGQDVRSHVFVEANFLKNVGREMPKTTDELYDTLKAFQEQDANGNGDPKDEIPLLTWEMDDNGSALRSVIMGAFTKISVTDKRVVDGGKVGYAPISDGYRQGLAYIAKLYKEGLLYSESFTIDRNTIWALAETNADSNIIGMIPGHHGNAVCNWDSKRWADYEVMGVLDGPNGRGYAPYDPGNGLQLKQLVSAKCKNPERAMQIFDYLATEDGMKLTYWGVEGHDYEKPADGAVDVNGDPALYRPFTLEERGEDFLSGSLSHGWPAYQTPDVVRAAVDPALGWQSNGDKFTSKYFENIYAKDLRDPDEYWPKNIYFEKDALNELALLQTDLDNAVTLAEAEFVMGVRDIDKDWDAYIADLQSMGLDKYLQISQQQYDANQSK